MITALGTDATTERTVLAMERFLNFFFGDYAFADQCPVVAVDADDCGGEDAAGVAGIEDQREAIT